MKGVKLNVTPFLRRVVIGRTRLTRLGRNFAVITKRPPIELRNYLMSVGMGMRVRATILSLLGPTPS